MRNGEVIVKEKGFVRTVFKIFGSIAYICFQWIRLDGEKKMIEGTHEKTLKVAVENNVKTYVAETQYAKGHLNGETLSWWTKFLKKLNNNGIEDIVQVLPDPTDNAKDLKKINNKEWKEATTVEGINIHEVYKDQLPTIMQKLAIQRKNKK